MAWGVIQDDLMEFPPGTVSLTNNKQDDEGLKDYTGVKKRGDIILQPQPSDNPNDPLHWSQSFKVSHVFIIAFLSAATSAYSSMIQPGLTGIAEQFRVSPDVVSSLTVGSMGFYAALTSFFVVSGAVVWGNRPFYLISIVMLIISNVVAYRFQTFPVLVAMRTIGGIATAPGLALVTASITDIFFAHERGFYIGLWNISLGSGAQIGQIISGFVIESLGVPAVFGFAAVVFAVTFIAAFFIVLESAFKRQEPPKRVKDDDESDWVEEEELKTSKNPDAKIPYRRQLALFRGRLDSSSFWLGVVKPFGMLAFPAVAYGVLAFAVAGSFLIALPILTSVVFAMPPYNLTPSQIGLTNIPLVVVSILGGLLGGWAVDGTGRAMASRNRSQPGVLEPEFRLVLLVLVGPMNLLGLIGVGLALDQSLSLAWVLVWLSVLNFASLWTTQVALTYVVDCFPAHSAQAFASINLLAAIVTFIVSGPLISWYMAAGPLAVFGTLGAVNVVFLALTIPVYVFGKRLRASMARVPWAQKLLA